VSDGWRTKGLRVAPGRGYLECREGFEIEGAQIEDTVPQHRGVLQDLTAPASRVLDPAIPGKEPGEPGTDRGAGGPSDRGPRWRPCASRTPGEREEEGDNAARSGSCPTKAISRSEGESSSTSLSFTISNPGKAAVHDDFAVVPDRLRQDLRRLHRPDERAGENPRGCPPASRKRRAISRNDRRPLPLRYRAESGIEGTRSTASEWRTR